MAKPEPLVYIIIVNFNGWQDTLECLTSLQTLSYKNYGVIVVDNASQNESVEKIKQHSPQHMLIESSSNLGFSGANNLGIREAQAREASYVWLLNNDTVVETSALSALVDKMELEPGLGMVGSTLIFYADQNCIQARAGGSYHKWTGFTFHLGEGEDVPSPVNIADIEKKLDYIVGASLLVRENLLQKIGLMPEQYFLYYEDVDWGLRAKAVSKLGYAPDSRVYHKVGSSIGTTQAQQDPKKRFRAEYYSVRSRLLITKTFYPYALPSVYLSLWLRLFIRAIRGEWQRVKTLGSVLWLLMRRGLAQGLEQ
jgi:GT2 family glycosyltransferase